MSFFIGRDFVLKVGDAETVETFRAIGAARAVSFRISNSLVDNTLMGAEGIQAVLVAAGNQSLSIMVEGLFRDAQSEAILRRMALERVTRNLELVFPNGDQLKAAFVVQDYQRGGSLEGLESFSATLVRSGPGTYSRVVEGV